MYAVIYPGLSCVLEYCALYGVCSFQCGASMFTDELAESSVEVWEFGCGGGGVGVGVVGYGPCLKAANGRINFCKRDVREDVPVDNPPGTRICRIVGDDVRVRFDLTDMDREA